MPQTKTLQFTGAHLDAQAEAMLAIFSCAGIQGRSAAYVSTPITTGESFVDWHERQGIGRAVDERTRNHVIEKNAERAAALIERSKLKFSTFTVEPVSLPGVPGWHQTNYHQFWCAFIERYAYAVAFNQGWYFSTGCTAEFATAVLAGCSLYDHELEPLTPDQGIDLLKTARQRMLGVRLDISMIDNVLNALGSDLLDPPTRRR